MWCSCVYIVSLFFFFFFVILFSYKDYLQKLNAICFYCEIIVSKVRYRSKSVAKRDIDSNLRRSFSVDNMRLYCMVNPSWFFSSRFSILNRFKSFVRFSTCRFFLQRDRLADSRFDCILLIFLSRVE